MKKDVMKKYQICEKYIYFNKEMEKKSDINFHAGGKAPSDVYKIALEKGYKPVYVRRFKIDEFHTYKIVRKIINFDWFFLIFRIRRNSIVLLQLPIRFGNHKMQYAFLRLLKKIKKVKFISLMHDIEILRKARHPSTVDFANCEFEFHASLKLTDCLIVHNQKMKQFIKYYGFPDEKIIVLEIFDYLTDSKENTIKYTKKVIYAGNLAARKCGFLRKLKETGIPFDLYGINYKQDEIGGKNINYCGSYRSNILSEKINSGFGLVWDGDELSTCSGSLGDYLRWNNPHKLSLYICAGIPVFIWDEAAEAAFVKENKIGFLIQSINDIKNIFDSLEEDTYKKLQKRVSLISKRIRNGFYMKKALEIAEGR